MQDFEICPVGTKESLLKLEEENKELYDALKETRHVVRGLVYEGYFGYVELRTKIEDVLEKADKD